MSRMTKQPEVTPPASVQPAAGAQELSDDEIVCELLRLARSGKYRKLEPFLLGAEAYLPGIAPERIRRCASILGRRMGLAD